MSFTTDLVKGLATTIADADIATYRADGSVYQPSETAVTFSLLPSGPDRCICITPYLSIDEPVEALSTIAVQLRYRGNKSDPHDVNNLADAVFQLLQALSGVQMGTAWVVQILRNSVIAAGQDDSLRWERTDNYYIDVNPPATPYRT